MWAVRAAKRFANYSSFVQAAYSQAWQVIQDLQ
jgi:hypothetical protein